MMTDTYNCKLLGFDMSLHVFAAMLIRISLVSHNALLIGKLLRVFRARFLPPYSVRRKMEATNVRNKSPIPWRHRSWDSGVQPVPKQKGQHMQLKHPAKKRVILLKIYYQLMHKRTALEGILKFTLKQLQLFRCNHHRQGAHYMSLLKLQC